MVGARMGSALVALVIGVAMVGAEREENTGCCMRALAFKLMVRVRFHLR